LEKGGMMDALNNQIIERKVIDRILADGVFKEVPYEFDTGEVEAVDQAAGGHDDDIPDAVPEGHPERPEEDHAEEASEEDESAAPKQASETQ